MIDIAPSKIELTHPCYGDMCLDVSYRPYKQIYRMDAAVAKAANACHSS
jgi:hypothetical protein